ncbi:splicing factor 1, isoform CRA_b [Homo sapiens]|uniref:Splicing factor 1, isoform CRA_b n=1 Tax=Homo sapiens TaxID=9606 RepID=Q14820_HUMAN|nr:splicing factor 1, isoform CRA_b [Homo sapiens]BAA05118.1 ZFM1 protein, alternatively spliced product [Homo sapiens]
MATGANATPLDFPSKKRKRSRWNQDTMEQKTVIPGMPTVIPPGLTREQERAYIGKYTFCIQMHFEIVTIYSEQDLHFLKV